MKRLDHTTSQGMRDLLDAFDYSMCHSDDHNIDVRQAFQDAIVSALSEKASEADILEAIDAGINAALSVPRIKNA